MQIDINDSDIANTGSKKTEAKPAPKQAPVQQAQTTPPHQNAGGNIFGPKPGANAPHTSTPVNTQHPQGQPHANVPANPQPNPANVAPHTAPKQASFGNLFGQKK